MTTSPSKRRRVALAALLLAGVAVPAIGQDSPESLLPPGFDEPVAAPAPAPSPAPTVRPSEAAVPLPGGNVAAADDLLGNAADDALANTAQAEVDLSRYELPEFARHSLDRIGVSASGNAPFPANGLGAADGRTVGRLLQLLDAPVASRWVSIVLRRALMSRLDTPANIDGADFAARRAWVLLRMGEANAARGVVSDVDVDNYTTELLQVAMQVALATADPAQLCPVADRGAQVIHQRGWALARAMCAGLAGKPDEAGRLLDQARWGTSRNDIDTLLAEKVLGTGAQGRRAVTIEWGGVERLTAWRWGLATATGSEVPAELYGTSGPQVRYWQALSPWIAPAARAEAAELAATAGVFSNAGLVDLYGEVAASDDAAGPALSVARTLRTAYADAEIPDRIGAIRSLWDGAETPRTRYARLILTARAASWIPVDPQAEEPEKLIASMLSAGLEEAAMQWRGAVQPGSEAWLLLALADPAPGARARYADFDGFADAADRRKAQMALAGLAGLGRLSAEEAQRGAAKLDVPIGGVNSWTRAIDAAGARGDSAMVALLAAVGMQSTRWQDVSPEALFHIVAAMRAAGMPNYARMIAVEAVTRAA